jgi:CelD/BcsL family acetyltransferase involved in cellulose biosynthesis
MMRHGRQFLSIQNEAPRLTGRARTTRSSEQPRRGGIDGAELSVRDDPGALAEVFSEWARLLESIPEHSIFASPEWIRTWWEFFGHDRRPHVAAARRGDKLLALAPLCTKQRWGIRIREFIGSEESDVGSLLLAPGAEDLAERLVRLVLDQDDWDLIDLWGVVAGSPTAVALGDALAAEGVDYELVPMTLNPVLDLRSEAWAASASRPMLRDLARQRRMLGRVGKLDLVFPSDVDEVETALERLRVLHIERWRRLGEMSPLQLDDYWAWVRGVALDSWREGWLYFPRLVIDGGLVATGLYLLYRRRLFYWVGAHESEFARRSPNQLLTLAVIEDVRSSGRADVLDFGSGGEPYKLRWTQSASPLLRVMAWRGHRGRLAHFWQGRVRPWAWAHQDLTRPMRRWRQLRRLLTAKGRRDRPTISQQ